MQGRPSALKLFYKTGGASHIHQKLISRASSVGKLMVQHRLAKVSA
jgi:hypothetical protein